MSIRSHPEYKNIYVSYDGIIYSYKRKSFYELKQSDNGCGYFRVGIGHENPQYVHRLVAETFISNPEQKSEINHKDGDKNNNNYRNLEWVTKSENAKHAFAFGLKISRGTPIMIIETGETFISQAECARHINGIQGNIALCLSNKRHSHRGYHFKYLERETTYD